MTDLRELSTECCDADERASKEPAMKAFMTGSAIRNLSES
jgi:hypothetical protein